NRWPPSIAPGKVTFMAHRVPLALAAIAAVMLSVLIGPPVYAGVNSWTSNGPTGELVEALAIDPSTPTTLYAGTLGGVFKSTDAGGSWTAITTGLTNLEVQAIAIDPSTPTTLYAGTGGGMFKSTDAGGSWTAMNAGLSNLDVQAIAINP